MTRVQILSFLLLSFLPVLGQATEAPATVVDFHIARGTGDKAWNTPDNPIVVRIGQILRFHNDDTVPHGLHTPGVPCEHGPAFNPGETWDCPITGVHKSSEADLYDHEFGPDSQVYIQAN